MEGALPALTVGSSVFLQLHLVLALRSVRWPVRPSTGPRGPALVAVAVLVVGTLVFWRVGRRSGRLPQSGERRPAQLASG
jgi:hypothetical protein